MIKHSRRILSFLLMLVMLVSELTCAIPPVAYAEETLGDTGVSDTPDELLSLGEWLYWVEDGLAIVAGYSNTDESTLTIPYQLGGYPVAGIGHRAFSPNSGLQEIRIHTNVTRIAADAFAGRDDVTIAAYHGAYALQYALAKGIAISNLSTVAEFADGAIDLTGLSEKAYLNLSDYHVTFIQNEATFLTVGQAVYFPAQSGYPTGLAAKIVSITAAGNQFDVILDRPDEGTIFKRLHLEDTVYLDWDHAIYHEGCQPIEARGEAVTFGFSRSLGLTIPLGDIKLSGEFSVNDSLTIDVDVRWHGIIPVMESASIQEEKQLQFEAKLSAEKELVSHRVGKRQSTRKTIVDVPFVGTGAIQGFAAIDIVVSVSGEISISYSVQTVQKWEYRNGKISHTQSKGSNLSGAVSGALKAGPEIKIYLVIGFAHLSIRFFEISAGVYYEATASLTLTWVQGTENRHYCLEIADKVFAEFSLKLGIIKVFSADVGGYAELKKTFEIRPERRAHWDYSEKSSGVGIALSTLIGVMFKVNHCDLEDRKAIFIYDNGQPNRVVTFNVNDYIRNPSASAPTRRGYRFDGWYIDTARSGLPGSDYEVIMGRTQMPYVNSNGTLYLRARWYDLYPVTSISLDKSSITGFSNVGASEKLNVTSILPTNANNKQIRWASSNTNVAAVDQNGNVRLKNAGNATITCSSVGNPSVKATCAVTVKQSVTGIGLDTNNIFRYSDNMSGIQLSANVQPSDAYDKSVTWYSDNKAVAEVSDTGYVTLKGLGTATITCRSVTNPNVTATCAVAVRQAVTGIELDRTSELRTNADMSDRKLSATVSPANAYNKALNWSSSNENVATVSADGTVSMKGVGTTEITCASVSNPNITATFRLQIIQAVREILLNKKAVTLYSDEKNPVQLTQTILPADAGNKAVTWETSNPAVVTVTDKGLVSVVAAGEAVVTCRSVSNPDVTAECRFTILQAVTGIDLNITSINTTSDEINLTYLKPTIHPANAYNKAVTWESSDPKVATVTSDGIVALKGVGEATITCRSVSTPYITETCRVTIVQAVTGLTLSEKSIVRYSNNKDGIQLHATLEAAELSDREVRWTTSNASVATVSNSGIVYPKGVGTAVITCTSVSNPDASDECLVTIRQSVTNISLNKTEITCYSDDLGSVQLIASTSPASAANKDLLWTSSDLAVATVSEEGLVTLIGPGTAVISCSSVSDPEISATRAITVYQAVTSLALNMDRVMRYTSESATVQLDAYALPSYAYNRDVAWESSNHSVATVTSNGLVNLLEAGEATITCTSVSRPDLSAVCRIAVIQAVTSVTLDRQAISLYNDETAGIQLNATILPENAVNKDLVWSSSNPSVVQVSDQGEISISGTGIAVITCRALSNPFASASCRIEVKQAVQSIILNETDLVLYADDTREYQLVANVQPAHAENKAVSWESSDDSVITVTEDGSLHIQGVGSATIVCKSSFKDSVTAQCTVLVKQPMEAITLDKDAIELYSDDLEGVQLTAAISPAGTDDTGILWLSDNETVAIVSDDGLVQAVGVGTATVSCCSARNPERILASCPVTVMQRVEAISVEGNTSSLLPRETAQLTATCYPAFSHNSNVVWHSDDPLVASVDDTGLVTAHYYGTAVITAASTDGGGVSASYTMKVEPELVLKPTISHETLYAQGNQEVILANVHPGNAAVRRMAEAGYELVWTLTKSDPNDDVQMEILPTTAEDRGRSYDTSYVLLSGSTFGTVGSRTYTVTCTAGPYSASADIVITIDGAETASDVTLSPSTFTVGIGQAVTIPNVPLSTDGKPIPAEMGIAGISGDEFFVKSGTCIQTDNGYEITFDTSGIYTAVVHYIGRNVSYDLNLSFYVRDEDGIIRIRTDSLTLDESYLVLVEGTTQKLNCAVKPIDAYDTSVTWTSSDESVATVDQNGLVTAIKPGKASIACTANDGFGATAICAVSVESFLQLDDSELAYTVYSGGDDHAQLGIVNVTLDSEKRLLQAGLNVTWSLEKLSGTACDIAVEEFRAEAEEGITVSGNRIKLLRIWNAGEDVYRLNCQAGEYSDSCVIHVRVEQFELPVAVTLNQTAYSGSVSEPIIVDTSYSSPALPEGTKLRIRGGNAFEHALSEEYDFTEPETLIFDKAGTFSADVVFFGDNYTYSCPITLTVRDKDGRVPVNITDLIINPESVNLMVGEQAELSCAAEPSDAIYSSTAWSSSDTSIATVSATGKVTAISAGIAFISVTAPESDFVGGCMVTVEDGLTLQKSSVDRTVFLDGITRTQLDTVQLTPASSQRLAEAPEWKLTRVSGNNLTLRVKEYNTTDLNGNLIYGCSIILYSLSRDGVTEYELTCSTGNETVSIPITVRAVSRSRELPAGLRFTENTFSANVNELIRVVPDVVCLPAGTALPDGMRVTLEGSALFASSVNTDDYCVSQNATTLSFNRAGVFEANFIYSYSNMRYVIPVTFRIMDENGNVPVLATSVSLNTRSLWLVPGESASLTAVFTPAEADDKAANWVSTNPSIVRVDKNGAVTAVGKGSAEIICTPSDTHLSPMICTVWVEDYLTLESGEKHVSLFRQGSQTNEVFSANLSEGTIQRLNKEGIVPKWELTRISGNHTDVKLTTSGTGDAAWVTSSALLSGGTDTYHISCVASDRTVSFDFTVEVVDLGNIAISIAPAQAQVNVAVGQTVTVDFTPVCSPAGTVMPHSEHMWSLYSGIGREFYNAVDYDVYAENGDQVTLRFTKQGRYLFSRQFFLDNLHYEQVCEIVVGESNSNYKLLQTPAEENIVYLGGKAGKITDVSLTDTIFFDVFDGKINWSLERVSGDSLDVIMKQSAAGVELYTVSADHAGDDVWRVTCRFGEYSESVDISINVRQPRSQVPNSVSLSADQLNGMMGDWLTLPIAVSCLPLGSDLPETGDEFWSFEPVGMAADTCRWEIEDGILRVQFLWPGYYTGLLRYTAGNFAYALPVYITVSDEEGIVPDPTLELYLVGVPSLVYAKGQENTVIGVAEISHGLGTYYAGESSAYMKEHTGVWDVTVTSGTAATLSVEALEYNSAKIILGSINGTGEVHYQVRCSIDGAEYTKAGTLTVANASAVLPDPSLIHSTFYASAGELVTIPTVLYERSSGTILQGSVKWIPDAVLPAIGYEYTERDDCLQMTFYKEGSYSTSVTATIGNLTYELPFTIVVGQSAAHQDSMIKLPAALTTIEDYAFEGIHAETVDLRGTKITHIGDGAFKNCTDLTRIYIPSTVTEISPSAFYGCLNVVIVCEQNSFADSFAQQNNIPVNYE